MAYQSPVIAVTHCEAAGEILIRLDGGVAKNHDASKNRFVAHWAKVGCYPCCVVARRNGGEGYRPVEIP